MRPKIRGKRYARRGKANNNNQAKNNKNQKKKDDEAKGGKKSKNEFEDWCTKALHDLQAQVDIPTFLGFLMDIESPYDVSNNPISTIKITSDKDMI